MLELLDKRLFSLEETRLRALNGSPGEDAGAIERECGFRQIDELCDALEALNVSPAALAGFRRLQRWLNDIECGSPASPAFTPAKPSNRPPLSKTRLLARGVVAGYVFVEEKRLRASGMTADQASKTAARSVLTGLAPHMRRQVADTEITPEQVLKWRSKYATPSADLYAKLGFEAAVETLEDESFDGRDGINFF